MMDLDELIRGTMRDQGQRARFDPDRWEPSVTRQAAPRRSRLPVRLPASRSLAGLAVAAVLAAAIAGPLVLLSRLGSGPPTRPNGQGGSSTATPGPHVRHADADDGLSILIPATWTFHQDPSGPAEPRTVFGVGSWAFATGGECAPAAAQGELPAAGALFWLIEYRDPQGNEFAPRTDSFRLDEDTLATYECSAVPSYLIRFQDAGRSFQVHVALGPEAPDSIEQEVLRALQSLEVTAPVPEECPPEVSSSGDPDCPEHAWLRAIVEAAGYEVTGNTGSAVVGKAGGVEFLIWTTEADPADRYLVPPESGFDERIYLLYQNIADLTVYTDGTRFLWTNQGFHIWIEESGGGPLGVRRIEPLVRASLTVDYDAVDTRP